LLLVRDQRVHSLRVPALEPAVPAWQLQLVDDAAPADEARRRAWLGA
jgi:hypothetical protein